MHLAESAEELNTRDHTKYMFLFSTELNKIFHI